jgi:hypothetical protein
MLRDFEREGPAEAEGSMNILLVDFQMVAGEDSELGLGKVGSWNGENYLAAFDGDVRVALHSFAGHLEVERDNFVPNWVKCGITVQI